jgi:prefoldin subunit 5
MSERGRNVFNQYVVGLVADAESESARLDANVEGLKRAAETAETRIIEVEEDIGALREALAARFDPAGSAEAESSLDDRVEELKAATEASETRLVKIEHDMEGVLDRLKAP